MWHQQHQIDKREFPVSLSFPSLLLSHTVVFKARKGRQPQEWLLPYLLRLKLLAPFNSIRLFVVVVGTGDELLEGGKKAIRHETWCLRNFFLHILTGFLPEPSGGGHNNKLVEKNPLLPANVTSFFIYFPRKSFSPFHFFTSLPNCDSFKDIYIYKLMMGANWQTGCRWNDGYSEYIPQSLNQITVYIQQGNRIFFFTWIPWSPSLVTWGTAEPKYRTRQRQIGVDPSSPEAVAVFPVFVILLWSVDDGPWCWPGRLEAVDCPPSV